MTIEEFFILHFILWVIPGASRIKFKDKLRRIASRENNKVILVDEKVIPLFLCWLKGYEIGELMRLNYSIVSAGRKRLGENASQY